MPAGQRGHDHLPKIPLLQHLSPAACVNISQACIEHLTGCSEDSQLIPPALHSCRECCHKLSLPRHSPPP